MLVLDESLLRHRAPVHLVIVEATAYSVDEPGGLPVFYRRMWLHCLMSRGDQTVAPLIHSCIILLVRVGQACCGRLHGAALLESAIKSCSYRVPGFRTGRSASIVRDLQM